ncbi:outer membrane beta-barrel domain-containing protein [Aliikangiella sp. G2MR2-5]|uniref:outer membrane beta-barrel domain-containing protein n=1 Tax=Aliikangiella sp. G2MR2-5 TaxID=2788943 RepID=UPI0018AC8730|nr:outer membrane beta-barrel domain-containing protein [Aliikangiella sp. G2MR2-5]
MESRIQRFLLIGASLSIFLAQPALAEESNGQGLDNTASHSGLELDNELFEIGFTAGTINIQDFTSEWSTGINATFLATENAFLQFNYLKADVGLSSYEKSQGQLIAGDDREFKHYDFLVGYDLYQGEQFFTGNKAQLSALYALFGVGDTNFGGEKSFTYTMGIGYRVALTRKFNLKLDFKNYRYESNLLLPEQTNNSQGLSLSINYLL